MTLTSNRIILLHHSGIDSHKGGGWQRETWSRDLTHRIGNEDMNAISIDIEQLRRNWIDKYPDCEPRAEILKHTYRDRWIRFYNLVAAKRYPENTQEQQTVLYRHNSIIKELGPQHSIIVLTCNWTSDPLPEQQEIKRDRGNYKEKYWRTLREDPDETNTESISYRHIYASLCKWHEGSLDSILTAVSKDELSGVILAPLNLDWLYHPYDGGMDVITKSKTDREVLRTCFETWTA